MTNVQGSCAGLDSRLASGLAYRMLRASLECFQKRERRMQRKVWNLARARQSSDEIGLRVPSNQIKGIFNIAAVNMPD